MSILPENYRNEVLNDAMGNRRQYRMIENANGTISFIDVSVYDLEGSIFNANDINAITEQVNLLTNKIPDEFVLGVKGDGEATYRVGQVNITPANIGTYTASEIDAMIGSGSLGLPIEIVDSLPTTNIKQHTIYLVPSANPKIRNAKDEYIYIVSYNYIDITDDVDIVADYSSLPEIGDESDYYITSDDGKVYEWNGTEMEYTESSIYPSSQEVDTLPSEGQSNVIYINTTDNKVYTCAVSGQWEQIGSTSIDLSNYYTKSEIDNAALISTSEFISL